MDNLNVLAHNKAGSLCLGSRHLKIDDAPRDVLCAKPTQRLCGSPGVLWVYLVDCVSNYRWQTWKTSLVVSSVVHFVLLEFLNYNCLKSGKCSTNLVLFAFD